MDTETLRAHLHLIIEDAGNFDSRTDIDRLRSLLCDAVFNAERALKLLDADTLRSRIAPIGKAA